MDVIAEIEDDIDIEVDDADIRTDVYRASGKGATNMLTGPSLPCA